MTATSSMSQETHRRPSLLQARAVVKPPPHGSTTRSPGWLKSRTSRSTSASGCCQSCHSFSFESTWVTSYHLGRSVHSPLAYTRMGFHFEVTCLRWMIFPTPFQTEALVQQ